MELEFRSVDFCGGRKTGEPGEKPSKQGENQQQNQPTYDAGSGNRTRDTLVGGERSHHCTIPASHPFLPKSSFPLLRRLFFHILVKRTGWWITRLAFFKFVNIRIRLGSPSLGLFKAIPLSFLFFPFSFFTIYPLILFIISRWTFHGRLCYSRCKIKRYSVNTKIAHSFPRSVTVARWGVQSCVSLVGGMATLTTALVRCEICEFLSGPKPQGLFLRELPLCKWTNRICRFIGF